MSRNGFAFDEASHTYTQGSRVIPGCTRVLDHAGLTSFDNVKADVLERRGHLGRIVHTATHYMDEGTLNFDSVAREAIGYVMSWKQTARELSLQTTHLEHQFLADIDGMPCGMRLDRAGFIVGKKGQVIIDLKISRAAQPYHGIQLAGYALGLPMDGVESPLARFLLRRRFVALLDQDGDRAKLVEFTDRNDAKVFQAGLAISHWKLNHGMAIKTLEEQS